MFPEIKKRIKDFIFEEHGRITKKSILILGLNAALLSAFARADSTEVEPDADGLVTMRHVNGEYDPCINSVPPGVTLTLTESSCDESGHGNADGHDSSQATATGTIEVKSGIFSYQTPYRCYAKDVDGGSNKCDEEHFSAFGKCQVTIQTNQHLNSLKLNSENDVIWALHDHSIEPGTVSVCIGKEAEGYYEEEDCHGNSKTCPGCC